MKGERKLYEVYDRKSGKLLTYGEPSACAKKLQLGLAGFRAAAKNPRHTKYIIRHVATMRKVYSVYYNDGLIARGSLSKVAEEMECTKSTMEYWGRIGQVKGLTIEVTEEFEQKKEAGMYINPCVLCGKDCEEGIACKMRKDWWTKVRDRIQEDIRKAAGV